MFIFLAISEYNASQYQYYDDNKEIYRYIIYINIYIYIYIYMCVCVFLCVFLLIRYGLS